jgi:hypothetical protein
MDAGKTFVPREPDPPRFSFAPRAARGGLEEEEDGDVTRAASASSSNARASSSRSIALDASFLYRFTAPPVDLRPPRPPPPRPAARPPPRAAAIVDAPRGRRRRAETPPSNAAADGDEDAKVVVFVGGRVVGRVAATRGRRIGRGDALATHAIRAATDEAKPVLCK